MSEHTTPCTVSNCHICTTPPHARAMTREQVLTQFRPNVNEDGTYLGMMTTREGGWVLFEHAEELRQTLAQQTQEVERLTKERDAYLQSFTTENFIERSNVTNQHEMEGDEHTGRQSRLGMDFMAIPAEAVASLARVLYEGGKTHQDPDGSNWRKIPVEGHLNHALFHINAWQRGVVGEDHLAHAMCRLVMAYTVENGG